MFQSQFKTSSLLSIIITILAAAASAAGLFTNLYRDNAFVTAAWRGNDLVTLFVAAPLLVVTLIQARRGSLRARLAWLGTLVYMLYNYAFYLFAAAFNACFWLYVALFALSIYALIFALPRLDARTISRRFGEKTPVKWIGAYMLFFALLLGGMWFARSMSFFTTGQVPQDITRTGHPTAMVYALDCSLLVPALLLGALWLIRRQPWGYVLATIMMVKATTYGLVLLVMSAYSAVTTGAGDALVGLWAFLTVGCALCLAFLLGNIQAPPTGSGRGTLAEPVEARPLEATGFSPQPQRDASRRTQRSQRIIINFSQPAERWLSPSASSGQACRSQAPFDKLRGRQPVERWLSLSKPIY